MTPLCPPLSLKIAYIGGGSRGWAHILMADLALCPDIENMENLGQISNLPLHAVVETNASLSQNQARPLASGALPAGVHALVSRHIANQEMIIEAALARDKDLAFQAIFNDPTTNLPIDRAWEMFNEIGLPQGWW